MKYDPDIVIKHLWIVLVAVVIIAALVIVLLPGLETRSECRGFQYFLFLDHKLAENEYSIEILNGVRDVKITSLTLEGNDLGIKPVDVKSGERVMIPSGKDPTNKKTDDTFRYKISIAYDIVDGIASNKDTAVCTGKVQ